MQFPGNEEGTPVDIFSDLAQVICFKYLGADESWPNRCKVRPVDLHLILLRLGKDRYCLADFFTAKVFLQFRVFFSDLAQEIGLLFDCLTAIQLPSHCARHPVRAPHPDRIPGLFSLPYASGRW